MYCYKRFFRELGVEGFVLLGFASEMISLRKKKQRGGVVIVYIKGSGTESETHTFMSDWSQRYLFRGCDVIFC